MAANYPGVIQKCGDWWIGWVNEVSGVYCQGRTREKLLENLRNALKESPEMNRADSFAVASGAYEEMSLSE